MPDSNPTQSPADTHDDESVLRLVDDGMPLTPEELWERTSSTFVHPFDDPNLAVQLTDTVADFGEVEASSVRPEISDNPDDFELWESAVILRRRERIPGEGARGYLQRWLYEEAFSVTQFPSETAKSLTPRWPHQGGMTPGGLASHYYLTQRLFSGEGRTMDILVEDIDWSGRNLHEVFSRLEQDGADKSILQSVHSALTSMYAQRGLGGSMVSFRDVLDDYYSDADPFLDSISLRLLQMLWSTPEMREEVEDPELVERFPDNGRTLGKPNRVELLLRAWTASQPLLTPEGTYNKSEDPEVLKALNDLLYFRTHPETQVFFRYLSPSGYINAARNSAQGEKPLE